MMRFRSRYAVRGIYSDLFSIFSSAHFALGLISYLAVFHSTKTEFACGLPAMATGALELGISQSDLTG